MDRSRDRGPVLSRRALFAVSLAALLAPSARGDSDSDSCGTDVTDLTSLLERSKRNPRVLPTLRYNVQQYLKKVNGRVTMSCTEVKRLQEFHRIVEFKRLVGRSAQA
ncbi:MAG: hypothetical protein AAB573_02505 [Patescibacteria group bacterium]